MAIDAASLPDPLKKELLRQVREKMGPDNYRTVVDRLGEDGVVELFLQATMKASKGEKQREPTDPRDRLATIATVVIMVILVLAAIIGSTGKAGWAENAWAIVAIMLANLGVAWWLIRHIHYTLGLALAGVLLAGALYVLYLAATFTAGGTKSWFQWLLGHF